MLHSCILTILFDMLFGEPPDKFHPTVWIGKLVSFTERLLYCRSGLKAKAAGSVLVLIVIMLCAGAGFAVEYIIIQYVPAPYSYILVPAVASLTIACKSLASHAWPVLKSLCAFDIKSARKHLSMIVGRDTEQLNRREISRATVETVAEGLGDGIISPLFFFAIFGLAGAFAYRAANTMDSMIGHKDERYADFGWAAARFDDLLNYIPARLLSFLSIAIAAAFKGNFAASVRCALKYHASHKSPNSGWLEAAAAGALKIKLGGTNYYHGEKSEYPVMNELARPARAKDIKSCVFIITFAACIAALILDCVYLICFH